MRVRTLFISWYALLGTTSMLAQTPSAASIAGSWRGEAVPDGQSPTPISMSLRVDGKTISGPVTGLPTAAEVKSGSYDPHTGAFRLDVGQPGSTAMFVVMEGYIVKGTAVGRITGPNLGGTFLMTKGTPQPEVLTPSGDAPTKAVKFGFDEVNGWVTKAADLVPADKYSYRPVATVRTFGQLVGHVADGYNYYCARAAGKQVEWSDAIEKGPTDKAAVVMKLKQALAVCTGAYGGSGDIGQKMANVAHTNLHYGNMITYIRMLGLTPPSS